MIPLTVMSDVGGNPRSKNSENARIIKASGVRGTVLDLETGMESIRAHVFQATRWVIYLGAVERGARTIGIGDGETVFWEGVQNSTGIVEEF